MKRKLIITLLALLILSGIVFMGGGFYMLDYALKPADISRSRDMQGSLDYMFATYPELLPWVDSLQQAGALTDLYMENAEGLNMHAVTIAAPQPTRKTAVIVHGYTDNCIRMLMIAYLYNRQLGYNVLLPDLHGHGLSDGEAVQMGWKDRLDVLLWTERADELYGRYNETVTAADGTETLRSTGTEMVVHGISMGAATTMMLSGEVQRGLWQQPYIKCFVEDCGYTSAWDEFAGELKARFSLPAFPLMHITDALCKSRYGWSFREASALEAVGRCTLPMLFIHGDKDDFVPTRMVYDLYEAKPEPKELWVVPDVDHAHAYRDCREEYTRRVAAFVERYIR